MCLLVVQVDHHFLFISNCFNASAIVLGSLSEYTVSPSGLTRVFVFGWCWFNSGWHIYMMIELVYVVQMVCITSSNQF